VSAPANGGPGPDGGAEELAALRAEHDRLAALVAARRSIDEVRKGSYLAFFGAVTSGLTIKFAWDRWGFGPRHVPPKLKFPLLVFLALAATLVLGARAAVAFARARRLMHVEDRDFAQLKDLREKLGIGT